MRDADVRFVPIARIRKVRPLLLGAKALRKPCSAPFQSKTSDLGGAMDSDTSEKVMTLLKELAVLKEQNKEYEANTSKAEQEAHRLRQQRHEEITEEIKSLAEQKKTSEQSASN
jgi:hypothetical protein